MIAVADIFPELNGDKHFSITKYGRRIHIYEDWSEHFMCPARPRKGIWTIVPNPYKFKFKLCETCKAINHLDNEDWVRALTAMN